LSGGERKMLVVSYFRRTALVNLNPS
jgi:hypothetical protein